MRRCLFNIFKFYCHSIGCDASKYICNNIYFLAHKSSSPVNGVNTYKIRYKELEQHPGHTKNNIDSLTKDVNNLTS